MFCSYYLVRFLFFFFNDTAPTEIYTLSLHDALPIFGAGAVGAAVAGEAGEEGLDIGVGTEVAIESRSEEHTSELQSRFDLVCRLLLEKKKNNVIYDEYKQL